MVVNHHICRRWVHSSWSPAPKTLPTTLQFKAGIPWDKLHTIIAGIITPLKDKGTEPEITLEIKAHTSTGLDRITLDAKIKETLLQIGAKIEDRLSTPTSKKWEFYLSWNGLITHHLIFNHFLPLLPKEKPMIAIIVDDLGYDMSVVKSLINLEIPLGDVL